MLYHSLQVFDLACNELPYDEEFLLAALLHDVGKAIDPYDHVPAGLEALEGFISPRIGARASRRLKENENYDELMLLCRCDRNGRQCGVEAPDVDEALDYLRELAQTCGG